MIIVVIMYQGEGTPHGLECSGEQSAGYLDVLQLLISWKPFY